MRTAHRVADVRAAEDRLLAELPDGALMERAAAGLAVACAHALPRTYGARVLLLVGSGGNGGDALLAGARLAARGARVTAVLAAEPQPGPLAALLRAGGRVGAPSPADLVVDGLVGIGGRGGLRPSYAHLVQAPGPATVVAVDVPSGVDADTGAVPGVAVRADVTVCFGTLKPGLLVGQGRQRAGRVELVPIGLELGEPAVEVLEDDDVAALLPRPEPGADKYTRGVVGVAAGSDRYPGAAVLAVGAAVRAGAGMVRYAGTAADVVRARWPEVVVTRARGAQVVEAGRVQAWVVGPGLGTDDEAEAVLEAVLAQDVPVLVDADGLTVLARRPELARRSAPTLLTPHDREHARFGTRVGDDRLSAARELAERLGVVVLLKGDATVVAAGAGPFRVNATGTPLLATAGTGDVLSGAAGALLAAGLAPVDAASTAAHLHGLAASVSARGGTTSASAVLDAWPAAVRAVRRGRMPA